MTPPPDERSAEWKQERPAWCPHIDCVFQRRATDHLCGGQLPAPEPHDGDFNTHRICINAGLPVFDLQVNASDLDWIRWIFRRVGRQGNVVAFTARAGRAGRGAGAIAARQDAGCD